MYKPMLTVMVGLSGSGKSTIAKTELADENTVIVSSDAIREELCGTVEDQSKNVEVFKLFHERIRRNLEKKKNVIADATNLTMKSRRAILMTVNGLDIVKRCYIVPKPYEYCLADNQHREHPVPGEVITKQRMKFQVSFMEEGWDIIQFDRRFIESNEYQPVFSLLAMDRMKDFDQKNPHHTLSLQDHCYKAYNEFVLKYGDQNAYVTGALLHDWGKLFCQTFDKDGIAHYFGHASISSYELVVNAPNPIVLESAFLANYHMLPFDWKTEKDHEKWKKRFGEEKYNVLMAFHECDLAAR